MFAVIKTGGKQYRVAGGDIITVDRVAGDVGSKVELGEVMMIGGDGPQVGSPLVSGATVTAEIVAHPRGDKVIIFKKKRRHNYRRKNGFRADLTALRIVDILADGAKPAAKKAAKPKAETPAE